MSGDSGDGGLAIKATLYGPSTIAVDQATGDVYFSEPNGSRVRRIGIDGLLTTVAGTGTAGYSGDCGPASEAQLDQPNGLTIHDGALYILDEGNHRVRVVGL